MASKIYRTVAVFLLGAVVWCVPATHGADSDEAMGGSGQTRTLLGTKHRGESTLTGTLYDLKQTTKGKPTDVAAVPSKAGEVVKEFIGKGWKRSTLNKYYHAPVKLHTPWIYVPQLSAEYITHAFNCSENVRARGIVAVYRGVVRAPKSGKFRFVGGGDEVLAVRFNGKTVLEWGYEVPSYGFSGNQMRNRDNFMSGLRKMGTQGYGHVIRYKRGDDPSNPNASGYERFCTEVGLIEGIPFEVKAGQTYPVEILISEFGGGASGYFLLIEDLRGSHPKVKSGHKLYHIFRTNSSAPTHDAIMGMVNEAGRSAHKYFHRGWNNDNMEGVPFDEDSLIWSVVPPKK